MPSRAKHFERWRTSSWHGVPTPQRRLFPRAAPPPRRRRARCVATREARRPRTRRMASSTSGRRSRRRARATSRMRVRAPTRPTPTRERPRGDARTPRPGARRPRSRLRWTTSLRWWSRRLTRGARWARSPARWAGPAYDARVREPSKPRMRSTRMRSTRRRDRERRATGIFYRTRAVGSRRGRASGWKRFARRKPTLGRPFARVGVARVGPRARLRRIRRKRLDIRREGARRLRGELGRKLNTHTKLGGDRSGTPPSRPARRTRRLSRVGADARLSARAAETEALRGPPRRDERATRRRFASAACTAFTALRTTGSFLTASTAFDRVGRRVASLHDAMGTRRTESVSPLDAADRAGRRARDHLDLARRFSLEKKRLEKPERVGDARVPGPRRRFVSVVVVEIVVREPSRRVKWRVWRVWRVSSSPGFGFDSNHRRFLRERSDAVADGLPRRPATRRGSYVCIPPPGAGRRPSPAA